MHGVRRRLADRELLVGGAGENGPRGQIRGQVIGIEPRWKQMVLEEGGDKALPWP